MKTTELAEIKTILKLADKENEESVKEKETRVVELTFAYEELRNKVIEEGKKFEGKCKELEQVKKQLKQAQEKSEEMKEDYERELDRIKFELKDSNNDCKLLQDENEGLKHTSTRGADQVELIQENKKLLFQLEESKLRFNHAKRRKEELESELDQANLKVISLESKGNLAGAEEIKRLKNQINELNIEIQKWKGKVNKEQNDREDISHKDREINELRREVSKLQEEVKRLKAQAKEKTAEKNVENLYREKVSEPPSKELGTIGKSSNELNKSNSSRVNEVKAVSNPGILLSPLAKSLSNLDIKSLPVSSSQPKNSQPLTQNDKDTKAQGVATGRGITKPSGVVDSKKRPGEQATESNLAKRSRLTNYGQAGMPKADSKEGNANIPGLPGPLSSTQHGRTTGVKTRSAAKRNVQAMRRENPESTRVQPRAQFAPPEMPLSPRKTNMSNIPQGPRTKIPKPGRSQVPRPAETHIPAPSARHRKPRGPLAPRENASKPAGDQPECKMQ